MGFQLVHVHIYLCPPGAQTNLVESKIVATMAPCKMWVLPQNWYFHFSKMFSE